ncbi:unnamed protein product [Urochloa humidicola]
MILLSALAPPPGLHVAPRHTFHGSSTPLDPEPPSHRGMGLDQTRACLRGRMAGHISWRSLARGASPGSSPSW